MAEKLPRTTVHVIRGGTPRRVETPIAQVVDYKALRVTDLRELLKIRGLSHKGRKAELVERLETNDNGA